MMGSFASPTRACVEYALVEMDQFVNSCVRLGYATIKATSLLASN